MEFELSKLYAWIFKTFCAVIILTNSFDIVMGVFTIAQHVANGSAGIIVGSLNMGIALIDLEAQLDAMTTGRPIQFFLESSILQLAMQAITICVFLIVYGRMIEIYLTISVAHIPFSTMVNKEWG